jgi:hypothetical protein
MFYLKDLRTIFIEEVSIIVEVSPSPEVVEETGKVQAMVLAFSSFE